MPELPEVETIRRHLAPHVEGRTLARLEIHDARWSLPLAPAELAAALEGREVERLGRRGKYLLWELAGDAYLLLHLRMTGTLLLNPPERPAHTRVTFDLGPGTQLAFVDPRRFGTGELALGDDALDAFFAARLGLEPFEPEFTGAHLHAIARRCRAPVKAMLLDEENPFARARAVLAALRAMAARAPTVIAIDDLQWLDHASARALRYAL